MRKYLLILFLILCSYTQAQDVSMYTKYTYYIMISEDETFQQIYTNILDRTFSMNLDKSEFYDEVNNQAWCALTVVQLYYLDEEFVESVDAGRFMLLFNSALLESEIELNNEPRFKKHYDWLKVLRSYVISSGFIRGNIRLRKEFNKI